MSTATDQELLEAILKEAAGTAKRCDPFAQAAILGVLAAITCKQTEALSHYMLPFLVNVQAYCKNAPDTAKKSQIKSGTEPSPEEVTQSMQDDALSYYEAREKLREKAYGGKPPGGYASWGDYWKSY